AWMATWRVFMKSYERALSAWNGLMWMHPVCCWLNDCIVSIHRQLPQHARRWLLATDEKGIACGIRPCLANTRTGRAHVPARRPEARSSHACAGGLTASARHSGQARAQFTLEQFPVCIARQSVRAKGDA